MGVSSTDSKNSTSDDISERFAPSLQMLKILLVIPTFDVMDNLAGCHAPKFTEDLLGFTKTAKSVRELSRLLNNALTARMVGEDIKSRDFTLEAVHFQI